MLPSREFVRVVIKNSCVYFFPRVCDPVYAGRQRICFVAGFGVLSHPLVSHCECRPQPPALAGIRFIRPLAVVPPTTCAGGRTLWSTVCVWGQSWLVVWFLPDLRFSLNSGVFPSPGSDTF